MHFIILPLLVSVFKTCWTTTSTGKTVFYFCREKQTVVYLQMFIGDGAKMVRDAFALAKEKAPSIIFIDELDAIGSKV